MSGRRGKSAGSSKGRTLKMQPQFREDLAYWIAIKPKLATRILDLVEAVTRDPFGGIGKPERLKGMAGNVWSRRIDQEHRLLYLVDDESIDLLTCRYHYE